MRKIYIALFFILASFPALAASGIFTANVDENSVTVGQSFALHLTLSNTSAKGAPDLSPLNQSFIIGSEGQSSSTTIINGNVTSSTGWELTLIPRREGQITVPPLTVETSDGALSTQPAMIDVTKASAVPTAGAITNGQTTVTATASTLTPYKGQPIFYTVKIIARSSIADLSLGDLAVDNAIVQKPDKPKVYNAYENGRAVKVLEARYIITPLSAGKITIPPVLVQGQMEVAEQDPFADTFGQSANDPFQVMRQMRMMQQGFGGFASLKPFTVASNQVELNVKPEAVQMDPWLPLESLAISDKFHTEPSLRVGDSITRVITIIAHGGVGKQLPNLEAQQNHNDFRVYADKPQTTDIIGDNIIGKRIENYTLIPLNPGKLTLPAIKVQWWDIKNNRAAYAELPARIVDVLPVLAAPTQPPAAAVQQPSKQQILPNPQPTTQNFWQNSKILYAIIGVLVFALAYVILSKLFKRKDHLTETNNQSKLEPQISDTKSSSISIKDLSSVGTVQELNNFIRNYAHENWGVLKNSSLEAIFSDLNSVKIDIRDFIKELTAALYSGKDADLDKLKYQCEEILRSVKTVEINNPKLTENLPKLNPD